jgi:membrane protease YdiL (CAAX protease family)
MIINYVQSRFLGHVLTYSISLVPLLLGAMLLKPKGQNELLEKFGLKGNFLQGLSFGIIATLPMFLGYAFLFTLNRKIDPNALLINSVSSGFFEEMIFRAYFFGLVLISSILPLNSSKKIRGQLTQTPLY